MTLTPPDNFGRALAAATSTLAKAGRRPPIATHVAGHRLVFEGEEGQVTKPIARPAKRPATPLLFRTPAKATSRPAARTVQREAPTPVPVSAKPPSSPVSPRASITVKRAPDRVLAGVVGIGKPGASKPTQTGSLSKLLEAMERACEIHAARERHELLTGEPA